MDSFHNVQCQSQLCGRQDVGRHDILTEMGLTIHSNRCVSLVLSDGKDTIDAEVSFMHELMFERKWDMG